MLKLAGLAAKYGSLKLSDVTDSVIREIATTLDLHPSDESIQKMLALAHSQDPTQSALGWAMQMWESGELEHFLNPGAEPEPQGLLLVRCPHCKQPFETSLN